MSDSPADRLRERLAAIEHTRWAEWQRYLHSRCARLPTGDLVIFKDLVDRWERQIAMPYAELSEAEQRSDLQQVDRYWPLIQKELEDLRDLVASMHLYFSRHGETQLTTEQKELLYDIVEAHQIRMGDRQPGDPPRARWWRDESHAG